MTYLQRNLVPALVSSSDRRVRWAQRAANKLLALILATLVVPLPAAGCVPAGS